jgi:hypothetical protein
MSPSDVARRILSVLPVEKYEHIVIVLHQSDLSTATPTQVLEKICAHKMYMHTTPEEGSSSSKKKYLAFKASHDNKKKKSQAMIVQENSSDEEEEEKKKKNKPYKKNDDKKKEYHKKKKGGKTYIVGDWLTNIELSCESSGDERQ